MKEKRYALRLTVWQLSALRAKLWAERRDLSWRISTGAGDAAELQRSLDNNKVIAGAIEQIMQEIFGDHYPQVAFPE